MQLFWLAFEKLIVFGIKNQRRSCYGVNDALERVLSGLANKFCRRPGAEGPDTVVQSPTRRSVDGHLKLHQGNALRKLPTLLAPKHHPTPLSGCDRKALAKELGEARAMANILNVQ